MRRLARFIRCKHLRRANREGALRHGLAVPGRYETQSTCEEQLRFIARQPVFDRNLGVFGYELLFRAGWEEFARISDSDLAARTTLDNSVLWGLDQLCDSKFALVNCTREVITRGLVELLPPSRTVLEVLEGITADSEMVQACRDLKQKGFIVALDDVTGVEDVMPYLGIAEMVKVDFRQINWDECAILAQFLAEHGVIALAEKVETHEEHQAALDMGYQMFQGFFLQRPELMRMRDIPAFQASHLRLLRAAIETELDFKAVEEGIRTEPSLCFRLLRYLNSPLFPVAEEIHSVSRALRLLGEQNIRNWLLVAVAASLGENKPPALLAWALTRARFCELLAGRCGGAQESFLLGMVSSFPALLEVSLPVVLKRLSVAGPIREALLGGAGQYRDILELVSAYESGDWLECSSRLKACRITEEFVTDCYMKASRWADEIAIVNNSVTPVAMRTCPTTKRTS